MYIGGWVIKIKYPCAYPGNFRRVLRCVCVFVGGGGGGVQARLTEKSSDVVFSSFL